MFFGTETISVFAVKMAIVCGLQKVLSFLPGTYGTSLLRNHAMRGVFAEMKTQGFPAEVVEAIRGSVDCNLEFFGTKVTVGAMYAILGGSIAMLICIYTAMCVSVIFM